MGRKNKVHQGAVIGALPQDFEFLRASQIGVISKKV